MKNSRSSRRRLTLAIVVTLAIVGVFATRLVDIQLVQADQLNTASLDKREISIATYAARGSILDTNGALLAGSVNRYDIVAAPINTGFLKPGVKTADSVMAVATKIAALTKQDPSVIYLALTKTPNANYALLSPGVDLATMRAVAKLKIAGVSSRRHPERTYPDGAVGGNLIGYMNTDGPGGGIEQSENTCLASKNGSSTYEQGADGVQIPGSAVTTTPALDGGTVRLTIDSDLQFFSQQALAEQATAIGAKSATAIVIREKDMHLMAAVDWPSIDPNNVNASLDNLGSHAFADQYEPGSVFKAMSAAMLIDTGIGTPLSQATVPSTWTTPEGGRIRDAEPHPVENLTLTGVLQQSSNVGMSMLGIKVPANVRYDYMKKFGIGEKTAVDFPGEQNSPLRSYKNWDELTKYNVLYGQGVTASALQVAQIYSTLGNGGVKKPLVLVESCTKPDGTVTGLPSTTGTRVVSDATAKTVVNMLESVVDGGELSAAVKIPGYRVAGKSGTAEVADSTGYGPDRIVSFAGIAPANDPQYVVLVTFTKPSTMKTSAAAAPTFKKIMSQVLTKYRVPPSTTVSTYPSTTW